MKKLLPIFILLLSSVFINSVSAQQGKQSIEVSASVGEFRLSVSGFIAPFASIVLKDQDEISLASTIANDKGYFTFDDVRIKRGLSKFCFTAVDFKQLGDSVSCVEISPAEGNVIQNDIFLPPTFGLSKSEINSGAAAVVRGYSMPGAKVTIHLENGQSYTGTADAEGYYEILISNVAAGAHTLFADAIYNGKQSLKPINTKQLKVLTLGEVSINKIGESVNFLKNLLSSLGLLLLTVPLLIIIIYLLWRLWILVQKRRGRLHHWWWIGY